MPPVQTKPTTGKKAEVPKPPETIPASPVPGLPPSWRDSVEAVKEKDGWIVKWMVDSPRGLARIVAAEKLNRPGAEHMVKVLREYTKDA